MVIAFLFYEKLKGNKYNYFCKKLYYYYTIIVL